MIDLNHNRACELSEAKHDKNINFNHVRFSRFGTGYHTTKIKIIL